jgi:uncharacterized membrane protein
MAAPPRAATGGMAPNIAAVLFYVPLCFIGIICSVLFTFILEPYKSNRFVRFHGWQSLMMHIIAIVLGLGWAIFSSIVTAIVHVFVFLSFPVSMLIGLVCLIAFVLLMIKAYGNEFYKLPVIGNWAEKQAGA